VLEEFQDVSVWRIVFCGAVVKQSFQWERVAAQVGDRDDSDKAKYIVNDCGNADPWPAIAAKTGWRYGNAGTDGFSGPYVTNRFHHGGHGLFFDETFIREYWMPFLLSGEQREGQAKQREGLPRIVGVLQALPLNLQLIAALMIVMAACMALSTNILSALRRAPAGPTLSVRLVNETNNDVGIAREGSYQILQPTSDEEDEEVASGTLILSSEVSQGYLILQSEQRLVVTARFAEPDPLDALISTPDYRLLVQLKQSDGQYLTEGVDLIDATLPAESITFFASKSEQREEVPERPLTHDELTPLFALLDKNRDGFVSTEELGVTSVPPTDAAMASAVRVAATFKLRDENQDGKLDQAEASEIGEVPTNSGDDRRKVDQPTEYPFSAICSLEMRRGSKLSVGTGFLIREGDRSAVLTAGYNLIHNPILGQPTEVRIYPGRSGKNGITTESEVASPTQFWISDGWRKHRDKTEDWGLILLKQDLGKNVGSFALLSAESTQLSTSPVLVGGYPSSKTFGRSIEPYTQWYDTGRVARIGTKTLLYRLFSTRGQGGSPVLLWDETRDENDRMFAVGIHWGDAGDYKQAVRITPSIVAQILAVLQRQPAGAESTPAE
jgi:V8-like Glu-specific endopeptidase